MSFRVNYTKWAKQQAGNPIQLVLAVLGFTMTTWFGYRHYITPWLQRRRLTEAEEFANIIIQQEEEHEHHR